MQPRLAPSTLQHRAAAPEAAPNYQLRASLSNFHCTSGSVFAWPSPNATASWGAALDTPAWTCWQLQPIGDCTPLAFLTAGAVSDKARKFTHRLLSALGVHWPSCPFRLVYLSHSCEGHHCHVPCQSLPWAKSNCEDCSEIWSASLQFWRFLSVGRPEVKPVIRQASPFCELRYRRTFIIE